MGCLDGLVVGWAVGAFSTAGLSVGVTFGIFDGHVDGLLEGDIDGLPVGFTDGNELGLRVEGEFVGDNEGAKVVSLLITG